MMNTRERDFTVATTSSLSCLIVFCVWGKTIQNLSVSPHEQSQLGMQDLGLFLEIRKSDTPGRSQRLCQGCWHSVVRCHEGFLLWLLLFSKLLFFLQQGEKGHDQSKQKELGISALCAQGNQECGLRTPFRSYLQEDSCDVRSGPGWQVQNALCVLFLLVTPCVCTPQGFVSSAPLPWRADPGGCPPALEKQGCKTQGRALETLGTGKSYGWTHWCQPTICPGCCAPEELWEGEIILGPVMLEVLLPSIFLAGWGVVK